MRAAPALAIELSGEDRVVLERWTRAHGTPQSVARRARVILLAAEGHSNVSIARTLGVGRPTVIDSRRRFCEEGLEGLARVRPGRGRPARQVVVSASPGGCPSPVGNPRSGSGLREPCAGCP